MAREVQPDDSFKATLRRDAVESGLENASANG